LREKSIGSVFRVYLPLSAEDLARPAEKAAKVPELKGGGKALLIEDDSQVRELGVRMLEFLGFTVLAAKDGMEGVEIFRERRDEIRFVLSDLTMPRMDGWKTIAALREIDPNVPIILTSGYDEVSVMSGDHAERPQVFLGKPYTIEDLREAIGKVI
jgi:CheY-like chemotaxis protein